ncbi:UNVERIFIED_CONTAM: hypothetical protein GTU68_013543 [Idotea baltica]|nr:hypothetical protein [Idotea baltica]
MKVIVTGAAGFIGFHLSVKLLKDGHQVIGFDNINDYYAVQLKYGRLAELGILESEFMKADLTNLASVTKVFNQNSDIVIHLAAQAGVRYSIDNPHSYIESNVLGFLNILESCRNSNCKKLVYASSSSIYGINAKVPFSADDRTDEPVSLYAATKKSNELMAYSYNHLYGISTTGIRFFTVYGPWGRPDMAYFKFSNKIMNNQPIQIYNNGKMQRDFTYIDDIVEGVNKIAHSVLKQTKPKTQVFNIGNSKPIDLLEFVQILEKELGKEATKEMLPHQPGDVYQTWADVSDLKAKFNYQPNTPLAKGIKNFVSWYKIFYKLN